MVRIPRSVKRFARVFVDNAHELYIVGGAVRDALLGKPLDDYDFATSATPEEVKELFRRVIPTGIQHGTVTVLFEGSQFEVTTYRVDGDYSDRRRPDGVTYTRSLTQDLARRDFTVNAIALDPITSEIVDPCGGRRDLAERIIRTVGCAADRFSEDALRMVRAVRFTVTLGFDLSPEVPAAIRRCSGLLDHVSRERIATELEKMNVAPQPSRGWRVFRETALLERFIPELTEDQDSPIPVFDHLLGSCDCAPAEIPVLRWAALFHDVGKPRCYAEDARGIHFHGHDEESARMATAILERLRFSNERIQAVTHLVRHHMFGYESEWSDAALRRFVSRVGPAEAFLLITLRRADACGKAGRAVPSPILDEMEDRLKTLIKEEPPLTRAQLAINGRDLISELGLSPGPLLGIVLDELMQTVLDDPSRNDRQKLLEIARNFQKQRLNPGK